MKSLGFNAVRGQLRYTVLDGVKAKPSFVDKGRLVHDPTMSVPEVMNWYNVNFDHMIRKISPDKVGYRFLWPTKKIDQFAIFHYPYGVLNLYCFNNSLDVEGFANVSITAKRLQMPKGVDLLQHCDAVLGSHPPHWDDAQRYSALAAWMVLS